MAVKAKFYVAQVNQYASMSGWANPAPGGEIVLRPVTRGEDNAEWASATPSGEIKMTIRTEAFDWFQQRLGKDIAIRFDDPGE
jgi:hypothetical protein